MSKTASPQGDSKVVYEKSSYDRANDRSTLISLSPTYTLEGELYSEDQKEVLIGTQLTPADFNLREEFTHLDIAFTDMLEEAL